MKLRILLLLLLVGVAAWAAPSAHIREKRAAVGKKPAYEIDLTYPVLSSPNKVVEKKLNLQARTYWDADLKDFRSYYKEVSFRGAGPGWSLEGGGEVTYRSDRLLVLSYEGSSFTGGAHPAPLVGVLWLDPRSGARYRLADFFSPKSNYLQVLASYCIPELDRREEACADADWVRRGADAKAANYKICLPSQEGFKVVFPSYQVAPYVAGPQEVLVPWKTLAPCLDPKGPLASFVGND